MLLENLQLVSSSFCFLFVSDGTPCSVMSESVNMKTYTYIATLYGSYCLEP